MIHTCDVVGTKTPDCWSSAAVSVERIEDFLRSGDCGVAVYESDGLDRG